jgi:hypothetical protein
MISYAFPSTLQYPYSTLSLARMALRKLKYLLGARRRTPIIRLKSLLSPLETLSTARGTVDHSLLVTEYADWCDFVAIGGVANAIDFRVLAGSRIALSTSAILRLTR